MATREMIDENERRRRRDEVLRVGNAAYGERVGRGQDAEGSKAAWHADLARAISGVAGREIGRARVAQWLVQTDAAKPVPAWVMVALPAVAASIAAELRARAAALDAIVAEGGAPPEAQGEPEADGAPPQESGPTAAAAEEPDFDLDGFMQQVMEAGPSGPLDGEEAMPVPPPVETVRVWSNHTGWYDSPLRR